MLHLIERMKEDKINKDFFLTCDFHWVILVIKSNGNINYKSTEGMKCVTFLAV